MATEMDLWNINWKLVQSMGELTDELSELKLQIYVLRKEREKLMINLENEKLKNLRLTEEKTTLPFWRKWLSNKKTK